MPEGTPRTIDEAEAAGWEKLEVRFACCSQGKVQMGRPLLRRRTRRTSLAKIAARAVCGKCGAKAADVLLHRLVPGRERAPPASETRPLNAIESTPSPSS